MQGAKLARTRRFLADIVLDLTSNETKSRLVAVSVAGGCVASRLLVVQEAG